MSTDATSAYWLKKASLLRAQACGQVGQVIDVSLCPQFFHRLAQLYQQVYHVYNLLFFMVKHQ